MDSSSPLVLLDSIDQTISEINKISLNIRNMSSSSMVIDAYFAKFLVVYICGLYEQTIENIVNSFTTRNSSRPEVVAFVSNTLSKTFRNPDLSKLKGLCKTFENDNWKNSLNSPNMIGPGIALESISENKNALAHGDPCTVTLIEVVEYYKRSRPLIEKFAELLS